MNLQFREITEDNWRKINVRVSEEQRRFVASYTTTLARAYIYRHYNSLALALYLDDLPIGILLQRDYKNEEGRLMCVLDQFFIDQHFQGKGYGKAAMRLWLAAVRKASGYDSIVLCFVKGSVGVQEFYESLGFMRNPQADDGDELAMILPLAVV